MMPIKHVRVNKVVLFFLKIILKSVDASEIEKINKKCTLDGHYDSVLILTILTCYYYVFLKEFAIKLKKLN